MTTQQNRPSPPALFDKPRSSQKTLGDKLSSFTPKKEGDFEQLHVPPASQLQVDGGTGKKGRRGKKEIRSKTAALRLTPTEFEQLNQLCDQIDKSYSDTLMFLVRQYLAGNKPPFE